MIEDTRKLNTMALLFLAAKNHGPQFLDQLERDPSGKFTAAGPGVFNTVRGLLEKTQHLELRRGWTTHNATKTGSKS